MRTMRLSLELKLVIIAGFALAAAWIIRWLDGPALFRFVFLIASAILSSTTTFPNAIRLLREFKLDVDVLMFVAAIGAALIGSYEEGALLLFLFGLGSAGESMAISRSRHAIEALTRLAPENALRINDDGSESIVPLEEVNVDDRVVVRPFDRIGLDGIILDGRSSIDESSLTGESMPITKSIAEAVFAGTLNGDGRLTVRVTRRSSDSTLARIIQLVEIAQSQRSPTQLFTDRIEKFYVPTVLGATLLLILLPPIFGLTARVNPASPWPGWFYQSMAFLTAASPCALAIGTPTAVLCGIARAAQKGVLIKGGAHLEMLGKVRAMALDKTGTLTAGKPSVDRVAVAQGVTIDEALTLAAAVDAKTTHPYAVSIVEAFEKLPEKPSMPIANDVVQIPGEGARGFVNGRRIEVGKSTLAGDRASWPRELRDAHDEMLTGGLATTFVIQDEKPIAVIGLLDRPRDNAAQSIARLREQAIDPLVMLTGDHSAVASQIAARVGITPQDVRADLRPEEKLAQIKSMRERYGVIAMVGDGVNDAPALAEASLGIAVTSTTAAAGAGNVAIETADVVLIAGDLRRLPDAIHLGRRTRQIIAQNLIIALGVIGIVAPLAALGFAGLGWAVLLHEGSTVVVVLSAMRLLRA